MCPPLREDRTVMVSDAYGWGHPSHQFRRFSFARSMDSPLEAARFVWHLVWGR